MTTGTLKIKLESRGETKTLTVVKVTATIGSAAHCDVRLFHPSVQGEHARAWLEGGRLWLQDLGGASGTFLNGTRLPPLKPMLVRPFDRLTVGACEDVLGFEKPDAAGGAIRAPRVQAPATTSEVTLTDVRPSPLLPRAPTADAGAGREERAKLSRELAEMRLQLQMAQLEKSGVDDLRKQVNHLRGELRTLEDERREFTAGTARIRDDEAERSRLFEIEIETKRDNAERDIQDMRDMRGRKLGHWKMDVVAELNRQMHGLLIEKTRAWVTRPFSQDMVFDLEGEMASIFRALLLEEDPHGGTVGEITRTQSLALPPIEAPVPDRSHESQIRMAFEGTVVARRPSTIGRRVVVTGLIVAVLGLGLEVVRVTRGSGGAPTERTVASSWHPPRDRVLKGTYVDNVLYTEGYVELMLGSQWQTEWSGELAKNGAGIGVDQTVITAVAEQEVTFTKDLRDLRDRARLGHEDETLTQMRALEVQFRQRQLAALGGDAATLARYVTLKRSLLARLLPH